MSNRYSADEVLKNPYTFMNEDERQFFEKFGDAIEQQADLIAEQHELDAEEQRADLDKLLQDLEKEEDEYVVEGALLSCSKSTYNKQTLMYRGKEIESRPLQIDARARICVPETRKAQIGGHIPAAVEDCKGGMRDISKGNINIFGFGNCSYIIGKVALEDLLAKNGLSEKKEEIRKAIEEGKGTCHCFMKLNDSWENLSMVGEFLTRKSGLPCGGLSKYFGDSPYLEFNGKEGINMMSMLLCQYGGGIITAQESGQAYVSPEMALAVLKEYLREGTIEEEQAERALNVLASHSPIKPPMYESNSNNDYNCYDTYIIDWAEYYRMEMGVEMSLSFIKSQLYEESRIGYTTEQSDIPTANVTRDIMQALDVRNGNIYDYIGISTDDFTQKFQKKF